MRTEMVGLHDEVEDGEVQKCSWPLECVFKGNG